MVIRAWQFNLNLMVLGMLLCGTLGCQMLKRDPKRQPATLRIHLESNPLPGDASQVISVVRSAPIQITIEKQPFLSEIHLASAQVVEWDNAYALSLQFNDQGRRLLEQYSAANAYRRMAIRSQFRLGTNVFDRWLGAPIIPGRISSGIISFTPDANREEAEAIARGWNNAAGYKPKKQN